MFGIDEIKFAYRSDIEVDVLERIVDSWSLPMGDVDVEGVEALIIANPIWERPFLGIAEGKYALFVPKILLENGCQLVRKAVLGLQADLSQPS